MKSIIKERKLFNYGYIRKVFMHDHAKVSETCNREGPLHGIRICDMTRVLAGPYCTMVLGDMGAEVIKIEREGVGDDTRGWGLPYVTGESYYNMSFNRNKKSVCVDIQKEKGRNTIYELVRKSDIFVENFVLGKLDSLGLGYDKLADINPSLIYCSINGYGVCGKEKTKPGYDLVANAVGGLLHVTGPKGGPPCRPGVALADILTGMYAHTAIIAALYERSITNCGKKINVSLFQSQVAMLSYHAVNYLNKGIDGTSHGSAHSCIVPSKSFDTKDGKIVITAADDEIFKKLCELINCSSLCLDNRFNNNSNRVENRDALEKIIEDQIKEKPSEYWLGLFNQAGVPSGKINNIKEAFDSPEVSALNIVQEMVHPVIGNLRLTGPAVSYDGKSFGSPPLPPPFLGEHTEEIVNKISDID